MRPIKIVALIDGRGRQPVNNLMKARVTIGSSVSFLFGDDPSSFTSLLNALKCDKLSTAAMKRKSPENFDASEWF